MILIYYFHQVIKKCYRRFNACMLAKSLKSCLTLCNPMDCNSPTFSVHGDSPGKNTGVGCHTLLQGIFLTQGSKPHLLWRRSRSFTAESLGKPHMHIHICTYIHICISMYKVRVYIYIHQDWMSRTTEVVEPNSGKTLQRGFHWP